MSDARKDKPKKAPGPGDPGLPRQPDWTDGLKRLYDSVVDEPLPDCFKELLSRLDDDGK